MLYFDHDTNASKSEELTALRSMEGGAAVDAYWMLIERIYEQEEPLVFGQNQPSTTAYCFYLMVDQDTFMRWVRCMVNLGLLVQVETDREGAIAVTSSRAQRKIAHYQEKCELNRERGRKGGKAKAANARAKQSTSQALATDTPSETLAPATEALEESYETAKPRKEKKRKEIRTSSNDEVEGAAPASKARRFVPPTVEQVAAYVNEHGYTVDAESFVDFYASKGWMVGRNKMKDWHAAVRTWHKRNTPTKPEKDYGKYDR